jgi:hypothetical protein
MKRAMLIVALVAMTEGLLYLSLFEAGAQAQGLGCDGAGQTKVPGKKCGSMGWCVDTFLPCESCSIDCGGGLVCPGCKWTDRLATGYCETGRKDQNCTACNNIAICGDGSSWEEAPPGGCKTFCCFAVAFEDPACTGTT